MTAQPTKTMPKKTVSFSPITAHSSHSSQSPLSLLDLLQKQINSPPPPLLTIHPFLGGEYQEKLLYQCTANDTVEDILPHVAVLMTSLCMNPPGILVLLTLPERIPFGGTFVMNGEFVVSAGDDRPVTLPPDYEYRPSLPTRPSFEVASLLVSLQQAMLAQARQELEAVTPRSQRALATPSTLAPYGANTPAEPTSPP